MKNYKKIDELHLLLEKYKTFNNWWVDEFNDDYVSINTFSYITITDIQCIRIKNWVEKYLNKHGIDLHFIFVGPYVWDIKEAL